MSKRAWYLVIGGAILVGVGLFAMRFPVYLDDFDQWGWQVKCGTGFSGDLTQAMLATNGADFASDCESALLLRRAWTIPLILVGAVGFFGALLSTALQSLREELRAHAATTESGNLSDTRNSR